MHLRRLPRLTWPMVVPLLLAVGVSSTAGAAPTPGDDLFAPPAVAAAGEVVTLVTGDQVRLHPAGDGRMGAAIEPAPRAGQQPVFEMYEDDADLYVIPSDAAGLIPERLDRELFNVTKLAENGYTGGVPVIVTGAPARTAAAARSAGLSVTRDLPSVDGYAATVAPDGWWETVEPAGRTAARAATGKVWLDDVSEITLDESAVDVGAPQAWADGYDGTGVTVAVLDTGIDDSHPDLAGKVVAAQNFTAEADTSDGNGHGTHVAGIVAGTGAASGGTYTGVAPGADLLIGKVCTQDGLCLNSEVLAGMAWAAAQADLVSISLGSDTGSDGTDPISQAVNTLTAAHDTLFVIAAGNNGAQGPGSIASPGAADAALTVGSVHKGIVAMADSSSRGPRLGDYAVKPDLVAPGVGIVSARAAGTSPGPIVGEHYTRLSGTSMATPHVAGAAAILLQQDPDRTPAALKATLAGTATTGKYPIYDQGGGRVNIPAALAAPVTATPAPLDLGYHPYPHDGTAPLVKEVTYTNRSDEPVTLYLSHNVVFHDPITGEEVPPPPEMFSIDPPSVTVAAGGTATATVSLDVTEGRPGIYGGYLSASGSFGEIRTAVGFHKERELYELSIEGIARDGRPAQGDSAIHIVNTHDTAEFFVGGLTYEDGKASVRVPPGDYFVMGVTYTYDGHDEYVQDLSVVGEPEIEITKDIELVLDAREADRLVIDTPADEEATPSGVMLVGLHRQTEGAEYARTLGMSPIPVYAQETEPVTQGTFELYTRTWLTAPELALAVTDPVDTPLAPRAMVRSPQLDGERELPLVWAGYGTEADYAGIDADGAAVLTMRGGPDGAAKQATAEAHGAAALLVMNDTTGNYLEWAGTEGQIPAVTLSGEEGAALRDLLDGGAVTLRLAGTPVSPYLYDLVIPIQEQIPADLYYTFERKQLATVVNKFHNSVPGQHLGEMRFSWRPYEFYGLGVSQRLPAPLSRTDYYTPGDTIHRQQLAPAYSPFYGTINGPAVRYRAGDAFEQTWLKSPVRPTVVASNPVARSGDTLSVRIPEWLDSDPTHLGWLDGRQDTSAFRLYQDGELVAETPYARGTFPLSPDPATYRLELNVARVASWWQTSTATRTAWTVHSEPGQDLLPVLLVDYDIDLDLSNTAPDGLRSLDLHVRHQPGVDGPRIHRAEVSVSYDGGGSWRPAVVIPGRDGAFTALFTPRLAPPAGAEFASVRVAAWDKDGNRVEQEIINAWRVS